MLAALSVPVFALTKQSTENSDVETSLTGFKALRKLVI